MYLTRITYDSIKDTDNLVVLACPFRVDFREEEKPEYPEKETPESQYRRHELRELLVT